MTRTTARFRGAWSVSTASEGVLKLTLRAEHYEWEFVTTTGGRALAHGEDPCPCGRTDRCGARERR